MTKDDKRILSVIVVIVSIMIVITTCFPDQSEAQGPNLDNQIWLPGVMNSGERVKPVTDPPPNAHTGGGQLATRGLEYSANSRSCSVTGSVIRWRNQHFNEYVLWADGFNDPIWASYDQVDGPVFGESWKRSVFLPITTLPLTVTGLFLTDSFNTPPTDPSAIPVEFIQEYDNDCDPSDPSDDWKFLPSAKFHQSSIEGNNVLASWSNNPDPHIYDVTLDCAGAAIPDQSKWTELTNQTVFDTIDPTTDRSVLLTNFTYPATCVIVTHPDIEPMWEQYLVLFVYVDPVTELVGR